MMMVKKKNELLWTYGVDKCYPSTRRSSLRLLYLWIIPKINLSQGLIEGGDGNDTKSCTLHSLAVITIFTENLLLTFFRPGNAYNVL